MKTLSPLEVRDQDRILGLSPSVLQNALVLSVDTLEVINCDTLFPASQQAILSSPTFGRGRHQGHMGHHEHVRPPGGCRRKKPGRLGDQASGCPQIPGVSPLSYSFNGE